MFTFTAMPLPRRMCPAKRRLRAIYVRHVPDLPPRKCLVTEGEGDTDDME
jgi:hypothetical protein